MKDVDSGARSLYIRIFFWFLYPVVFIAGAVTLKLGLGPGIFVFLGGVLLSFLLPFPFMLIMDQVSGGLTALYGGRGVSITLHEQLTTELVKIKHLKTQGKFQEALKNINAILEQMPEHPDAMLLKAQILWEGFEDHALAKKYLRKVIRAESSAEEAVRQWASGLLDEIEQQVTKITITPARDGQ